MYGTKGVWPSQRSQSRPSGTGLAGKGPPSSLPQVAGRRQVVAQDAALGDRDRLAEPLATALLVADLKDAVRLVDDLPEDLHFVDRQRHRLLAIDMLAGSNRIDVDRRVPMVGRGADHRVDIVALEQLPVIRVDVELAFAVAVQHGIRRRSARRDRDPRRTRPRNRRTPRPVGRRHGPCRRSRSSPAASGCSCLPNARNAGPNVRDGRGTAAACRKRLRETVMAEYSVGIDLHLDLVALCDTAEPAWHWLARPRRSARSCRPT